MSSFDLLRLPLLPLKDVLNLVYIGDLIRLHLCSKKTRVLLKLLKKTEIIKNLSIKEKEDLNILETLDLIRLETYINPLRSLGCFPENAGFITITIESGNGITVKIVGDYRISKRYQLCFPLIFYVKNIEKFLPPGRKGYFEFDSITVPVVMKDKHTIHTFWKDQSDGLAILVEYLKKFINAQTINYVINGSKSSKFSQNLRIAVNGMAQQTIVSCEIQDGGMKNNDYILILDNVKPTYRYVQDSRFSLRSDNFRRKTSFSSVYFVLKPANWFTFNNLIKTDCEYTTLTQTRLTNADMCKYLKLWMTGKLSKLKRLTVELKESVKLDYIFSELKRYSESISLSAEQKSSKIYTVAGELDGICVKKKDVTVAKISCTGNTWSNKKINFFVWRNSALFSIIKSCGLP